MIATEYCKNVFDGTHDSPKFLDNGYLLVTSKNIANRELDLTGANFISEEDYNKINERSKVHQWDIFFSMIGTVGNVFLQTEKEVNYAIKNMGVFSCENEDKAKWLYYYLQSPYFKKLMNSLLSGAVQKFVPLGFLRSIDIPKYDDNKKAIVKFLSSLDDKISLNNRINAKLEQMAKRLYDYWFVQFDFPNADGKPYKASGGKMVWNEELKREIPEGWEVKSINDISVSYRGVGYTADDEKSETDENVVLILRGNNISNNHIVFDSNTVYLDKTFVSPDQEIHKFDLVMTMSSGSKEHVGKSAMFLYDSSHSYGAFCNKITPNEDCQYFLENYLHSEYFKKYIKVTCSGTGINNLTNEHFDKAKFAFPDDEVLKAFNEKMNAIYEKRGILEQENLKLTSLRDKLLPLLMNGQVVVE